MARKHKAKHRRNGCRTHHIQLIPTLKGEECQNWLNRNRTISTVRRENSTQNTPRAQNTVQARNTLQAAHALSTTKTTADKGPVLRCDVWYADLGEHPQTSVQEGIRPVLIVSNNTNNRYANTVTVVPLTSKRKSVHLPVHVWIDKNAVQNDVPLQKSSMVLVEQITTIPKAMLHEKVGHLNNEEIVKQIDEAILCQLRQDS